MLAGGAAAEVRSANHDVAGFHPRGKVLVNVLHAVTRELLGVGRGQVPRGDDHVRIDVIAILDGRSSCVHALPPNTVSGETSFPAMADAAATAGEAR
ncbi:hypothetical protein SDC9_212927 [bioreactor metagenome]|uniref:Uncharacterized protein n=1 Tax=bioreactor metagenome TaxID=1076179 RepID=A0A645JNA7_9ZZZZ